MARSTSGFEPTRSSHHPGRRASREPRHLLAGPRELPQEDAAGELTLSPAPPGVFPSSALFVTTTSSVSIGMSSSSRSWTSGPIAPARSTWASRRVATATTSSRRITVLGSASRRAPCRRTRRMKARKSLGSASSSADRLVHEGVIGHAIGPDVESPGRRGHPGLRFRGAPALALHLLGLVPEVDPHELGPDRGDEPHEHGRPDQVGDRVGDGDVVDERAPSPRPESRQPVDRVAGGPDHRGLGERPGQEPGRRPHVVARGPSRRRRRSTRHVTHSTTVTATCERASFFRPRKNWGPTL